MLKKLLIYIVFFLMQGSLAFADTTNPSPELSFEKDKTIEYKLSLGDYSTQSVHSNDINLRAERDNQRAWVGYYKESSTGFDQWRGGYERTDQLFMVNLDTSLQVATHGFLGGSITATTTDPFF